MRSDASNVGEYIKPFALSTSSLFTLARSCSIEAFSIFLISPVKLPLKAIVFVPVKAVYIKPFSNVSTYAFFVLSNSNRSGNLPLSAPLKGSI